MDAKSVLWILIFQKNVNNYNKKFILVNLLTMSGLVLTPSKVAWHFQVLLPTTLILTFYFFKFYRFKFNSNIRHAIKNCLNFSLKSFYFEK